MKPIIQKTIWFLSLLKWIVIVDIILWTNNQLPLNSILRHGYLTGFWSSWFYKSISRIEFLNTANSIHFMDNNSKINPVHFYNVRIMRSCSLSVRKLCSKAMKTAAIQILDFCWISCHIMRLIRIVKEPKILHCLLTARLAQ